MRKDLPDSKASGCHANEQQGQTAGARWCLERLCYSQFELPAVSETNALERLCLINEDTLPRKQCCSYKFDQTTKLIDTGFLDACFPR